VIFDLRDVETTTPETDKRRLRVTVVASAALVIVLGILAVIGFTWVGGRLDEPAARARGESVLAAIAWPDGWDREKASLGALLAGSDRPWTQRVTTNVADLSTADAMVRSALTASGWQSAEECRSDTADQISCAWTSGDYRLRSEAAQSTASPGAKPCPDDRTSCVQVTLTLDRADPEKT
jgi:hypothetical protein